MVTLKEAYRRLLRIALEMPDFHRRRLVAWRARRDAEIVLRLLKHEPSATSRQTEIEERLLDLDILADNLEFQAAHLQTISKTPGFIPVDLHSPDDKSRRRRLLDALRPNAEAKAASDNRFMKGSPPSWIKQPPNKDSG